MEMKKLISVINKLQDVFSTISSENCETVQLPQIVVVGEQSSGKSSVLENLIGRSCFPRGTGIVTRCPIVLQLIQLFPQEDIYKQQSEDLGVQEWCEFPHLPSQERIITNFDDITNIITQEVDRRAGRRKGIIKDELIIKIYSPSVTNLTVVDLPGIVKIPIGDQSADIEQEILELLTFYIKNPNSIILAVSSANNDIATSESIKLAMSVDPNCDRTILVITKLDLMDHGTDARDVLTGTWLDVKLGIIGLVNRSFEDLKNNKSISESVKDEAEFLRNYYPEIASFHGTPFLRRRLSRILMDHIKKCVPALQSRLTNLKIQADNELKQLGGHFPLDKPGIMLKVIEKFAEAFRAAIIGKNRDIEKRYLMGGSKLNHIFEDVLFEKLQTINPSTDLNNVEILNCIGSSSALESSILFPEAAYQDLVRNQIRRLVRPALEIATLVNTEMLNIMQICLAICDKEMERFPCLKMAIQCEVNDLLEKRHLIAQEILKTYVDVQASFIKTIQKPFNEENVTLLKKSVVGKIFAKFNRILSSGGGNQNQFSHQHQIPNQSLLASGGTGTPAANSKPQNSKSNSKTYGSSNNINTAGHPHPQPSFVVHLPCGDMTDTQADQCLIVRQLVNSYFQIVKLAFLDYCPKAIAHSVIYYAERKIQTKLVKKLYHPDKIEVLVKENSFIAEERERVVKMIKALEAANEIVWEITDTEF